MFPRQSFTIIASGSLECGNSTARSSVLDVCYAVQLRRSKTSHCSCNKEACHVWKKKTGFEIWYLALKFFLSNKNLVLFGKRSREY